MALTRDQVKEIIGPVGEEKLAAIVGLSGFPCKAQFAILFEGRFVID
jgi:hypothetical protein